MPVVSPKLGARFLDGAAAARDVAGERRTAAVTLRSLFDHAGNSARAEAAVAKVDAALLWPMLDELGTGSFAILRAALERELGLRAGPDAALQDRHRGADPRTENPYLDAYRAFVVDDDVGGTVLRMDALRRAFAYAVPTDDAIALVLRHSPVVELGAGTGYWAWLLRHRGADVAALDLDPPDGTLKNRWFHGARTWTHVDAGGIDALPAHKDRALFLCWPPSGSSVALDAVVAHGGDKVIFAGAWAERLATPEFYDVLGRDFREVERAPLPSWFDDESVFVLERRRRRRRSPRKA